jgi:hypothetical protein
MVRGGRTGLQTPVVYLKLDLLPKTISDAIWLTKVAGEKYLWVDSLCIIQDDPVEMAVVIAAMAKVYGNAIFTIVAANGGDANAALPGLRAGSRNIQEVTSLVEGVQLAKSPTFDHFRLSATTWANRGWTFQEYQLSKRCHIFAEERVYYECARGVWPEANPTASARSEKVRFLPPPPYYSDWDNDSLAPQIWEYAEYVRDYTGRELSYEGDILNAFEAILHDQATKWGVRYCWGLPTNQFFWALCWSGNLQEKPLRRRIASIEGAYFFPSWSWSGFIGMVSYDKIVGVRTNI